MDIQVHIDYTGLPPILDLRLAPGAHRYGVTETQIWDCITNRFDWPLTLKVAGSPAIILLGASMEDLHLTMGLYSEGEGVYRVFHARKMRERERRWFRQTKWRMAAPSERTEQ